MSLEVTSGLEILGVCLVWDDLATFQVDVGVSVRYGQSFIVSFSSSIDQSLRVVEIVPQALGEVRFILISILFALIKDRTDFQTVSKHVGLLNILECEVIFREIIEHRVHYGSSNTVSIVKLRV